MQSSIFLVKLRLAGIVLVVTNVEWQDAVTNHLNLVAIDMECINDFIFSSL